MLSIVIYTLISENDELLHIFRNLTILELRFLAPIEYVHCVNIPGSNVKTVNSFDVFLATGERLEILLNNSDNLQYKTFITCASLGIEDPLVVFLLNAL